MKCIVGVMERASAGAAWLPLLALSFEQLEPSEKSTAVCLLELSLQHSPHFVGAIAAHISAAIAMAPSSSDMSRSHDLGADTAMFVVLLLLLMARDPYLNQQVRCGIAVLDVARLSDDACIDSLRARTFGAQIFARIGELLLAELRDIGCQVPLRERFGLLEERLVRLVMQPGIEMRAQVLLGLGIHLLELSFSSSSTPQTTLSNPQLLADIAKCLLLHTFRWHSSTRYVSFS